MRLVGGRWGGYGEGEEEGEEVDLHCCWLCKVCAELALGDARVCNVGIGAVRREGDAYDSFESALS